MIATVLIVMTAAGADAAYSWASDEVPACAECAEGFRGWICELGNLIAGACRDTFEGARTIWY